MVFHCNEDLIILKEIPWKYKEIGRNPRLWGDLG